MKTGDEIRELIKQKIEDREVWLVGLKGEVANAKFKWEYENLGEEYALTKNELDLLKRLLAQIS
jgi:hypothetical protein